jgi:hypothetical protein
MSKITKQTVFRTDGKDRSFTNLSNTMLQDDRIPWDTRGMLADLLSRQRDWEINISGLQAMSKGKSGRDHVRRMVNDALGAGYIVRISERSEDGKFEKITFIVSDDPQAIAHLNEDYPATAYPATAYPATAYPTQQNKDSNKAKIEQTICASGDAPDMPPVQDNGKPSRKKAAKGGEQFEASWKAYRTASSRSPGSKPKALAQFEKLSDADRALVPASIEAYRADCAGQKFGRGECRSMADMNRFLADFFRQFADDIASENTPEATAETQRDRQVKAVALDLADGEQPNRIKQFGWSSFLDVRQHAAAIWEAAIEYARREFSFQPRGEFACA